MCVQKFVNSSRIAAVYETVLDPRVWQSRSRPARLRHGHAVGLRLACVDTLIRRMVARL